ncbi:MAG: LacI family DNA-binding transcriptional regulator [Micrococcales bacterium]|nr:LacI family DNA-binding transcriptional regulator [Micrococcales bacterium]
MSNRVKAADVARLAGVSRTAVSFVLNGRAHGNIAPATAERVRAAAQTLGYTPDRVAQALRLQRTHVVGLVTDAIASSPFAGRLLSGALDRAADSGYVLVLFDSQNHLAREQEAVEEFTRRRVDGLVYATMGLRRILHLPQTSLPMVLANCFVEQGSLTSVIPDNVAAGAAAAAHLLGLGHRHLVMLGGPGDIAGTQRIEGFRAGLVAAGAAGVQGSVIGLGKTWTIDVGYNGTRGLFTDARDRVRPPGQRPTAIFAINDRVATGALLALSSLGLRVPDDVSILGFDDQEQLAAHVVPALTTFALPHRAMGEVAIDRLLAQLSGREGPRDSVLRLPCPLIERESTAPPASS